MNTGQMSMMKTLARPVTSLVNLGAVALPMDEQKGSGDFSGLLGGFQGVEQVKSASQTMKTTLAAARETEREESPVKPVPQNAETMIVAQMSPSPPAVQQQERPYQGGSITSHEPEPVQNAPVSDGHEKRQEPDSATAGKTADGTVQGKEQPVAQTTADSAAPPPVEIPVAEETGKLLRQAEAAVSDDLQIASDAGLNVIAMELLPESNPDTGIETELLLNRQLVLKEMALAFSGAVAASEAALTSGDLLDSGADESSLDQRYNGQMPVAQVHGGQKAESGASASPVAGESRARQEVLEQVAQQLRERLANHELKAGSQQIKLTLSPENLGELKMSLNLQGQKLSVEIIAENRMVCDVIRQNTDALKESLARQNITMESFDVTTGEKGSGSGTRGQNSMTWQEMADWQQQQQLWAPNRGFPAEQPGLPLERLAWQKPDGYSMLDIHY